MSKTTHDRWMPLHVGPYLKATSRLTAIQHGAYLLLLMEAWSNDGLIPDDDDELALITRMSPREWRANRAKVLRFWTPVEGGYRQERLDQELARAKHLVNIKSEAGKASAEARKRQRAGNSRSTAVAAEAATEPQQTAIPIPIHTLPSEENAREARLPSGLVDQVWGLAPSTSRTRSSRKDVERTLRAALKRGAKPDEIVAGLRAYFASPDASKDDGAYAKGVHRMIEADRWRDWATPASPPASDDGEGATGWAWRLRQFRGPDRVWVESMWGPRPGQPGCLCPAELLEQA